QPLHLEGRDALSVITMPAIILLTIAAFLTLRAMAKRALALDDLDEDRARSLAAAAPGSP
ncbi:MAG TPA: hypothetical protein VGC41_18405, partial [Kofleriaceae bacterium]